MITPTVSLVEQSMPSAALPVPFPDLSFSKFVLDNGLTLIVHEDHSAPLIATELRFKVGSKDEPAGRHGFAHLFEHLMFKDSANRKTDWHIAIADLGGMNVNGTTSNDRTNYYQTVPTGAIDTLLWMESDRMGHLLGGLTPKSLADEIEVVKNEKRQRESEPGGWFPDLMADALYPAGHPYAHTTLGSFEDLDNATLETARDWFETWYGAANAVLVLAGDITPEDALAKVTHWFGSLPAGRIPSRSTIWTPPMMGARRVSVFDKVPVRNWYRIWTTPGYGSEEAVHFDLLAGALSGTTSTPLRRRLIEQERLCHDVSANMGALDLSGYFLISATLVEGADVTRVEAIIQEELDRLLTDGPPRDVLDYETRKDRLSFSHRLESLPAKVDLLIASECVLGSPDAYRKLDQLAEAATPERIAATARAWLGRDALTIDVLPHHRHAPTMAEPDRAHAPTPLPIKVPTLPRIESGTLSNGIKVQLVNRPGTGSISIMALLQGGSGNEATGQEGLTAFTIGEMINGTKRLEKHAYRAKQRLLNAKVHGKSGIEYVTVSTTAQTNAFGPVVEMMAEYALEPAYPASEFDQDRAMALASLANHRETVSSALGRFSGQLTYGVDHHYTRQAGGTIASLEAMTRDMLVARHAELFRPAGMTIFVVGDITLVDAMADLERAFGTWHAPGGLLPLREAPLAPRPGRYLVEGAREPQSTLSLSLALPEYARTAYDNGFAPAILNYALGGCFGSRLNQSLRVKRGWTYGANSGFARARDLATFTIGTQVQTDRTIDALDEIEAQLTALTSSAPITQKEIDTAKRALLLQMPGQWTSNGAVLSTLVDKHISNIPEAHYATAAERLENVKADDIHEIARHIADIDRMTILVGGDPTQFDPSGFARLDKDALTV